MTAAQHTLAERQQDAAEKSMAAVLLWREFMRNNYKREDMPDLWDPLEEAFNAIKAQGPAAPTAAQFEAARNAGILREQVRGGA